MIADQTSSEVPKVGASSRAAASSRASETSPPTKAVTYSRTVSVIGRVA